MEYTEYRKYIQGNRNTGSLASGSTSSASTSSASTSSASTSSASTSSASTSLASTSSALSASTTSSSTFVYDLEIGLRITALILIIIILISLIVGIYFFYKRFLCGSKKIIRTTPETPSCPPGPSPTIISIGPLKSVSNNSEFATAPYSFNNWKERKISAPTLLDGSKEISSFPTFVY
jgi:hypothetical protein